jgi:nucleotide-binding universal stress UspA family protein
MKTVLAAIDFSPVADLVLRRGLELAKSVGARLVVMHVIQPPVFIADEAACGDGAKITAAAARAADRHLAAVASELRREHEPVETRRLTGSPVPLILDEAASLRADFIVVGSHGHGAVYDLLVGSTAGGILKKARCPVLVVPDAERPRAARG